MRKNILIFILFFIGLIISALYYLSVYGIKTNKFNDLINEKFHDIEPKASLKINDVFFKLNLKDKFVNISTKDIKIYIDENYIDVSDINISLDLIKYIKKEDSIRKIEIKTEENGIKNVTNFLNSYKFNLPLFIFYNQIKSGKVKANASIYFNNNEEKKISYEISGGISDANLNIFNKTKINNINFNFHLKDKLAIIKDVNFLYEKMEISSKQINIFNEKKKIYSFRKF